LVYSSTYETSIQLLTSSPGLRAVFTETQSPELNEVLKEIQEKIILPAHLPEKQRKLIFDPKMTNYIQQNPIVIELDGLEHKFKTINRFRELPNSKKIFYQSIALMQTKEDWDNLATLLAGYKKAGIVMKPHYYSRLIRAAGRRGQIHSIIDCVKQSSKTGFTLSCDAHIIQLLHFINKEKPETAVKWTDGILDLLQRREKASELNPLVLGQVLFAQVTDVQNKTANQVDVTKETAQLKDSAQHLAQWWSRQSAEEESVPASIIELQPLIFPIKRNDIVTLSGLEVVHTVATNIKGMALAREVLGDAANGLEPVEQKLEAYLREFAEKDVKIYREIWATAYEETLGKKPEWNVQAQA
jgi:hypothetical protein